MAWYERPHDPQQQRGFDLIGAMVRRRRVALGWTQRYLEARSGIDQAVISRLENGKQSGLRWSRFAELIAALDGLDVAAVTRPWPAGAAPLPNAADRLPTPTTGCRRRMPPAGAAPTPNAADRLPTPIQGSTLRPATTHLTTSTRLPTPNAADRLPTPIQGSNLATGLDPSDAEHSAAGWSSPEGFE